MKVLVLCGGASVERIVSLASGDAVAAWIAEAGHDVLKYDPEFPDKTYRAAERMSPEKIGTATPSVRHRNGYDPAIVRGLLATIDKFKADVVFPILHGGYGEDGTLQALLDWVGIPYTGCGSLACKLAMNKEVAKTLMRSVGVPVADGFVVPKDNLYDVTQVRNGIESALGFPVVVKPLYGGSTAGLTKVFKADELGAALQAVAEIGDDALIEAHFDGRETTVTVVDGKAYPVIEIKPKAGFYDYANKYTSGRTEYICPAELSDALTRKLQASAEKVFAVLGCRGFVRVDFLVNSKDEFICLELNTLPGMTTNSLVPKAARAEGIEPPQLMEKILHIALGKSQTVFE